MRVATTAQKVVAKMLALTNSGSVVGTAAQVEVSFTSKILYHYGAHPWNALVCAMTI